MDEAAMAKRRDAILNALTDAENAKVSTAEGRQDLKSDDSFVDLENLDKGVQQGKAGNAVGHVIPKSAVSVDTWNKIVALLK